MLVLPLILAAAAPQPMPVTFNCGRTTAVARFAGNRLSLEVEGRTYAFRQVRSASGARYLTASGKSEFWNKHVLSDAAGGVEGGDSATLKIGERRYPECRAVTAEVAYRAVGQEPGWTLDVAPDGRATLKYDYGEKTLTDALAAPVQATGSSYTRKGRSGRITLAGRLGGCQDSMSGKPYAETVRVTAAGRDFQGCGGKPMDGIAGGEWVVEDIGGGGIIDRSRVTISIEGERIAGRSGCNRYSGSFSYDAAGIAVGPLAGTKMACAPALMNQETKFLRLLGDATRYRIDGSGALIIETRSGATITARR